MISPLVGEVPGGWETLTLGELAARHGGGIQTGPFGSQLHASDYVLDGVPSVMPQNIGDNFIVESGIARISEDDARRLSKYRLELGDIVYSRRGDVERRALVRNAQSGWLCGTGCLRVRLNDSANSAYVSYYLGHEQVRSWVVRHAVGATMPNLNTKILSAVPVTVPSRAIQNSIAELLGALDEKIALSNEIIVNVFELTEAHYEGLVEELPVSRITTFGDLAYSGELVFGDGYRTKRSEHGRPGLPILRVAEVLDGRVEPSSTDFVSEEYRRAMGVKVSQVGDVVLTTKGTVGRVAIIPDGSPEYVYSPQICFFRVQSGARISPRSLFFWFRGEEFWRQARGMKGQTDMADYLSLADIRSLKITVPSPEALAKFEATAGVLMDRIDAAHAENKVLAELRDTLLPRLISGELRIKDAERLVEDTV